MLDNPQLSHMKVGKQVGVSDAAIRYWKKQPFWEQYEKEIINERREIVQSMIEENREKYKKDLEDGLKRMEVYLRGLDAIASSSIAVSAKAYNQASKSDDPMKACGKLTKSGAHIHGRMAVETVKTIATLHEQIYQTGVVFEHIQSLKDDDSGD